MISKISNYSSSSFTLPERPFHHLANQVDDFPIVPIIIGVVVFVVLILLICLCCWSCRIRRRSQQLIADLNTAIATTAVPGPTTLQAACSYASNPQTPNLPVIFRPNPARGYKEENTSKGVKIQFTNPEGHRTIFLNQVIYEGVHSWTVQIDYGTGNNDCNFWIGTVPYEEVDNCSVSYLGKRDNNSGVGFNFWQYLSEHDIGSLFFGLKDENVDIQMKETPVVNMSFVTIEIDTYAQTLSFFVNGRKVPRVLTHVSMPACLGVTGCEGQSFTSVYFCRLPAPTPSAVQCRTHECRPKHVGPFVPDAPPTPPPTGRDWTDYKRAPFLSILENEVPGRNIKTLMHGTTRENAAKIRKDGFFLPSVVSPSKGQDLGPGIYLAENYGIARRWADGAKNYAEVYFDVTVDLGEYYTVPEEVAVKHGHRYDDWQQRADMRRYDALYCYPQWVIRSDAQIKRFKQLEFPMDYRGPEFARDNPNKFVPNVPFLISVL